MELTLETGRPSDTTGRLEKEIRVYDFLDSLNIPYQRVDHEALMPQKSEEAPPARCHRSFSPAKPGRRPRCMPTLPDHKYP